MKRCWLSGDDWFSQTHRQKKKERKKKSITLETDKSPLWSYTPLCVSRVSNCLASKCFHLTLEQHAVFFFSCFCCQIIREHSTGVGKCCVLEHILLAMAVYNTHLFHTRMWTKKLLKMKTCTLLVWVEMVSLTGIQRSWPVAWGFTALGFKAVTERQKMSWTARVFFPLSLSRPCKLSLM